MQKTKKIKRQNKIILAVEPKSHSSTFGCITFTKIKKKIEYLNVFHIKKYKF